jgi:hypothetical protein
MGSIWTQLFEDTEALAAALPACMGPGTDVVALFSLGIAPEELTPAVRSASPSATVLLADCYGVLGHLPDQGRNLELMESGRGMEYGGVGGDGGRAVVAVVFSGGGVAASSDSLPSENATSHMVVTAGGGATSFLATHGSAVYYGGVAKGAYLLDRGRGQFESVPHFFVSTLASDATSSVGTTSFTSDAGGSVKQLLDRLPAGARVQAVGLFPCFMRGKNTYGENNVEPDAIGELLPEVPIFGMFCHGELGPGGCQGFDPDGRQALSACRQHSMTSIVAVHAVRSLSTASRARRRSSSR